MANTRKTLTYEIVISDKGKVQIDKLTKGFVKAETAFKKLGNEIKNTTEDGLNPMIDKTGLAGATLVEFGRTLSDAPYGFRGIANNLSQLSTLFTTLIATTGGFNKAMESLGKAFKGPLGYIVIFQAAIALLDYFIGGTKEATKETDNLSDALQNQIDKFNILSDIEYEISEQRNKRGTRDRQRILKTGEDLRKQVALLSSEYKDFEKMFETLSDFSDESVNGLVDDFKRLLELKSAQSNVEKKLSEAETETANQRFAKHNLEKNLTKLIEERIEIEKKYQDQSIKNHNERTINTEEEIKFNYELNESELKLKDARVISMDEELAKDNFMLKFRQLNHLEKINLDEEAALAELDSYYESIDNTLFYEQEKEKIQNYYEGLRLARIKGRAEEITRVIRAAQGALSDIGDVIISHHDARMQALARERDYILNSGRLTGDAQKKAIADIERRELDSQKRKIKAERELFTIKQSLQIALEVQKAISEGKQIAITAVGATAAAQMSIGQYIAQLGPAGKVAYALSIGGVLASILSARKKAQAELANLGGAKGSLGGGGVEAPDFNIVGASPESQLAQTVSEQQEKPLRAFVVHKDIKNANSLDRTITETSALG